ncbi:MAG: hypothetical protein KC516_03765 [Nanoarchaeota archaeon]|nr:hypothetical protein [Nanoarchaeota archaeon]
MGRFRKTINEIRSKSFPEIKGKILLIIIPFPIPGGSVHWPLPRLKLLALTTKCRKLDDMVLRGIIAHELSHLSAFEKWGYKKFWKFYRKATKKEVIKHEKDTDKLTIKKGYGKEVIATKKKAKELLEGTRWEKYLDNYLTEEEVKKYIKKLEK